MNQRKRRWHGYVLGISAIAWAVLVDLARNYFAETIDVGGVIGLIVFGVIAALALYWLASNLPEWWQRFLGWLRMWWGGVAPPATVPPQTELASYAEQAQGFLVALGSDNGGMAAAEWFEREEPALRRLLESDVRPESVDELAWICDALEAGYVRQRRPGALLELGDQLAKIGTWVERRDLEELAQLRAATASRLLGELDDASSRLRAAADLATPGPAAAARRARRQLERGLLHLAWAERCPPGDDRAEEVLGARAGFDAAGLSVPRADLAADVAIHLNLAVVYLYQHDAEKALDHLRLASARASAARDASARAHALELTGVAAWLQDNRRQAVLWWEECRRRYADVDEREGEARCLQHLGSAALLSGDTVTAGKLLEGSAQVRGGVHGHEVLAYYLDLVRPPLGQGTGPPPEHVARPNRVGLIQRIRLLLRRLR